MAFTRSGIGEFQLAKGFQAQNGARFFDGAGFPKSGTSGTGVNARNGQGAPNGSLYMDVTNDTLFVNEGTKASPYWTPVSMTQPGIVGVKTDFRDKAGRAGTVTTTESQDNGLRYFGLGINENDANTAMTVSYPVGGPLLTMGTENQANYMSALGYGSTTALWTPASNGVLVAEVDFTAITDILTRSFFLGFTGETAAAMKPPVAGDTVTLTFQATATEGDNVHGLFMDSRLTAASTLFLATNKSNAAATQTATDAALTVAGSVPAAGTYVRLRVEIDADGTMRAFVNKVLVKTVSSAAATAVALSPVFGQTNTTTTASLQCGVRSFGAWAKR